MNALDRIKAKDAPDLSEFAWEDPFRLADQLTEDERMLAEAARVFADGRLAHRIRAAYAEERVEPEVVAEMGEAGLLGITIPEEFGGLGSSYVT